MIAVFFSQKGMLDDCSFCLIFLSGPLRPLTTAFRLLPTACADDNDGFVHGSLLCPQRSLPRAREAKTPPEQRMAETTKVIFIHFRKEE